MANRILDLNNYFNVVNKESEYVYSDLAAFDVYNYNDATPSHDYRAIKNAIRNILEFRLGQRPLDPTFGNNLYTYVYEPNTAETHTRLKNAIIHLLSDLDQRIIINDIVITSSEQEIERHEINVYITYYIKGLDNSTDTYSLKLA